MFERGLRVQEPAANRVLGLDPLTRLANRPALIDALERAISGQRRHGNEFALLYIELDGFKAVNDSLGHAAGDEVWCQVAVALITTLRRDDIVARIGGDEFAALLAGGSGDASQAADRVRHAVETRMRERGWLVTASIGAVSFCSPPDTADAALIEADHLMYAAKRQGKNRVLHKFQPGSSERNASTVGDYAHTSR